MRRPPLRIGQRLALGYGLVILLLVATTVIGVTRLRLLSDATQEALGQQLPTLQAVAKVTTDLGLIARAMRSILLMDDASVSERELADITAASQRIELNRSRLRQWVRGEEGRLLLDEIDVVHSAYGVNQEDFIRLLGERQLGEARNLLVVDLHGYQASYFELLDRLSHQQEQQMADISRRVEQSAQQARLWLTGFAALAVLLSIAVTIWVTRYLLRKLGGEPDYAATVARQIAVGNLAPGIELAKGDHSSLLFAMSAMRDALIERDASLRGANRDLAHHLDSLRQTQAELVRSEKIAALGHLVVGVAHELNTPIGNCTLAASTLQEEAQQFGRSIQQGLTRSGLQAHLTQVQASTELLLRNLDRASGLVDSFKRLAVDKNDTQRQRFELTPLVDEACTEARAHHPHQPATLHNRVAAGLWLDGPRGPLAQVLEQLVANALLHAFAPGQPGEVEVRAQVLPEGQLEICVTDQGKGVPAADLPRLFDPFFTTKLGSGSSGLGLHICFNIVTGILGGQIDIESPGEHGCQVRIRLPKELVSR